MKWATSISEAGNTAAAIADVRHAVEQALGEVPDLLIVFASPHHNAEIGAAIAGWRGTDLAREMRVIGCSALGVIGEGHEVEQRRCLAVAAATLPGVAIEVTAIDAEPAAMPASVVSEHGTTKTTGGPEVPDAGRAPMSW